MFSNYQSFLQIIFSIVISVGVWGITSISILTLVAYIPGNGGGFISLTPNLPFSQSAKYGLMVGAIHGLLTALIIYWHSPQTAIGTIISTFIVTEFMIAVGFVIGFTVNYLNQPVGLAKPPTSPTSLEYGLFILMIAFWFVMFSVLFLVPSIIIGVFDKLLDSFFDPNLN